MSSKIPRASRQQKADQVSLNSTSSNSKPKTTATMNGKSAGCGLNRSYKKPATSSFSSGTQKTMSYNQLKQEVGVLQEENCDLRNKFVKQQNALHSSQKTTKHLQKENQELKKQIAQSEKEYTDSVEAKTEEWTSRNTHVEGKLTQCEVKLEELGVDPVSLVRLDGEDDTEDKQQQKVKAVENATILRQKLEDNIARSQEQLQHIKDISSQCQVALAELDY